MFPIKEMDSQVTGDLHLYIKKVTLLIYQKIETENESKVNTKQLSKTALKINTIS